MAEVCWKGFLDRISMNVFVVFANVVRLLEMFLDMIRSTGPNRVK
jgi:hypothetical protein